MIGGFSVFNIFDFDEGIILTVNEEMKNHHRSPDTKARQNMLRKKSSIRWRKNNPERFRKYQREYRKKKLLDDAKMRGIRGDD